MDWMYKGVTGLVDREEYLKGRKVDKTFEIIEKEENKVKSDFDSIESHIPEPLFDLKPNESQTVTVDLASKLREDPLYEIRLKQKEQRRQLLDNPLKLKKLKSILESTLSEDKHKKHKKKRSREDSEDSSDASDRRHKTHSNRDHYRSSKSYSKSSSRQTDSNRFKRSESNRQTNRDKDTKSYKSREYDRKHDRNDYHKNRSEHKNSNRLNSRSHDSKHKSNKLSEEELEKKRNEMMKNAIWREEDRKSKVKSYTKEELEETKFNESSKSAQFIKPLLKSVTESDSLEKRLKQKRFTSQRSYNSMDTNFAKKS